MSARDAVTAYIALGANLGDAARALRQAVAAIHQLPLTRVEKTSSLYKTAPLETGRHGAPGGDYINAVIEVQTALTAPELLKALQQLELAAGRERPYINAPRTLDLDVLLYGSSTIDSPHLTVPHPRMMQRAFVLVPLAEIAPGLAGEAQLAAVADQAIKRVDDLSLRA
ncbi:MAG: 2-amino-4-hydroxy-6-hydroxymethyldihydropteridine diphosphokinase [Pseudomonadota bacterium]